MRMSSRSGMRSMVLPAAAPNSHASTVRRLEGPLLVFGPRSTSYDFGPDHPLTPRRFGPGIDLLRAVGAEATLEPEPALDEELLVCHSADYVAAVRRLSADPDGPAAAGLRAFGDTPAFPGMHEAAAAVAGGSLRAVEAILRGDVEHAYHPGGGLHHALHDRASGFCIYDDPALAIARARRDGLRVLYLDFDVHHGDGVQALHWDDPGVMTVSIHESGRYLFPGTGFAGELGQGRAAGTSVNVPLEPFTGEQAWLDAVRSIVPPLAGAFGPDLIVSQHGADAHAWDPLAHLRVTTTAMGQAARLVDALAHRHASGRWLATGGGGYDVYRVVPRAWALTWLAGAHREVPAELPAPWRERWGAKAEQHGQWPVPGRFEDEPNAGLPMDRGQEHAEAASRRSAATVRDAVVPRLLREGVDRGWWSPLEPHRSRATEDGWAARAETPLRDRPAILDRVDAAAWERLTLVPRVVPPADPEDGNRLLLAALRDGARLTVAVDETRVVGVIASRWSNDRQANEVLVIGVAPAARRAGLAGRLVDAHLRLLRPGEDGLLAEVGVAERDPVDPLDHGLRIAIARRLLDRAGCRIRPASGPLAAADPSAIVGVRG